MVRQEAIKTLISLFGSPLHRPGLRQFSERFKPRLVEMGTHDMHFGTKTSAVQLLTHLSSAGFLQDSDKLIALPPLLFSNDAQIRAKAGEMAAETWASEFRDPAVDDACADRAAVLEIEGEVEMKWIEAKSLARMLVELAAAADRAAGSVASVGRAPDGNEEGSAEVRNTFEDGESQLFDSLSQSLNHARDIVVKSCQVDQDTSMLEYDGDDEMLQAPRAFVELDDESKESLVDQLQLCHELASWSKSIEEHVDGCKGLLEDRVELAVKTLYEHIDIIKVWLLTQTEKNY